MKIQTKITYHFIISITLLASVIITVAGVQTNAAIDLSSQSVLEGIVESTSENDSTLPLAGQLMDAIVYAYNSVEEQTDSSPFITASGKRVRDGIVANNCLKFGTPVDILGEIYIVEDRMNSRYGCEYFDIWMESLIEAKYWGERHIEVIIYE